MASVLPMPPCDLCDTVCSDTHVIYYTDDENEIVDVVYECAGCLQEKKDDEAELEDDDDDEE
jgi:hypothetical protein